MSLDAESKYAALDDRVLGVVRHVRGLEHTMRENFGALAVRLDRLSTEMSAGQKTQWPVVWAAMGVCVSILGLIGGILYYPIRSELAETKATIVEVRKDLADRFDKMSTGFVSRQEIDWRATRAGGDRDRAGKVIATIRDAQVPRAEYEERWRGADQRNVDMQRQIDQVRAAFGETYSLRDFVRQMQERIDRLEARPRPPPS